MYDVIGHSMGGCNPPTLPVAKPLDIYIAISIWIYINFSVEFTKEQQFQFFFDFIPHFYTNIFEEIL